MTHPTEDTLLSHALELLPPKEQTALDTHLNSCPACRARRAQVANELARLGSLRIELPLERPPLPVRRPVAAWTAPVWLKAAALLLVGFLGGLATMRMVTPSDIDILPMPRLSHSVISEATAPADVLATHP